MNCKFLITDSEVFVEKLTLLKRRVFLFMKSHLPEITAAGCSISAIPKLRNILEAFDKLKTLKGTFKKIFGKETLLLLLLIILINFKKQINDKNTKACRLFSGLEESIDKKYILISRVYQLFIK